MTILPLPTRETLSHLFDYDPETGGFIWRYNPKKPAFWNGRFAGKPAFTNRNSDGYCITAFTNPENGRRAAYLAHRVAWVFITGREPEKFIDHINGDRADNRASNLREATDQENKFNRRWKRPGSSQYRGVHRHSKNGRWIAQIRSDGRAIHLGSFTSEIEAAKARDSAAIALRGEYASLNFPR
ncbi:AP2/ERF family transcription factor [Paracoccus sp. pheM1]|uniref:AP2/ERF family transcription factor n=1 Tax=Paracoccus sp. pheM1 TaxID=2831675 RepID=UPI001BDB6EB5|nr:AP2/ERF family transcription factor [Paracoccus sp. pheM1]MBT0780574.1 HNH endonuclease [Paracoccus sp. pheM1]